MNVAQSLVKPIFGYFELDQFGTVLYSKVESEGVFGIPQASIVGQDFFEKLLFFENAEEFRKLFKRFVKKRISSEKFFFDCRLNNDIVRTKMLMTQISERENGDYGKIIVVDLRKV